MGVGSRTFRTFLCDSCGREVVAEEDASIDGYYIEVLKVVEGRQVSEDNVYACSDMCLEGAIRDSLKRAQLPPPQKVTATQELWLRGRKFVTNPSMPILDAKDETRIIGTAHEIQNYTPQGPPPGPLDPEWKGRGR